MDDTTEQLLWEDEADEYVENEEEQQDQADADQPAQEQQQEHVGDQGAKEVEQPKPARTRTAIVFQPDSRPSTRPGEEAQQAQQQQAKPAPSRQALANKEPQRPSTGKKVSYFVIRSNNQDNVDISVRMGGWATPRHNETRLEEAFRSSDEVRLLFSVNNSGSFLGYAVMRTPIGKYEGGNITWSDGRTFPNAFGIDWRCLHQLPFQAVAHLSNPLNEGKPLSRARDGQEVPQAVGDEVVAVMERLARESGAPLPPRPVRGGPSGSRQQQAQQQHSGPGRGRGGSSGPGMGRGDMMGPGGGRGRGFPGDMGAGGGRGMMMGMRGGFDGGGGRGRGFPPRDMMMHDGPGFHGMGGPGDFMMPGMEGMGPGMWDGPGGGPGMLAGMGMGGASLGSGMSTNSGMMGPAGGAAGAGPSRSRMAGGAADNRADRAAQRSPNRGDLRPTHGSSTGLRERSRSPLRRDAGGEGSVGIAKRGGAGPAQSAGHDALLSSLGAAPGAPDLLSLSYDEYIEYYRKVQRKMEGIKEAQRGVTSSLPPSQPQQQQQQQPGTQQRQGQQNGGMSTGSGMGMGIRERTPPGPAAAAGVNAGAGNSLPGAVGMPGMGVNPMAMQAAAAMGMGIPPLMAAGGMGAMLGPLGMGMGPGAMMMMGPMGPLPMLPNPMMMAAAAAGGGMGAPMIAAGGGGMGSGQRPLSEAEYIQYTIQHFRSQGKEPPSEAFIREHYHREQRALAMGGGMRPM